jgi:hypothetical protein
VDLNIDLPICVLGFRIRTRFGGVGLIEGFVGLLLLDLDGRGTQGAERGGSSSDV